MGYDVNMRGANFTIPADKMEAACQALKDLNKRDELKSGGGYGQLPDGSHGKREHWFSWMDPNYDQNLHTVAEILEALGFELSWVEGEDLELLGYYSKQGDEQVFLAALAPFVPAGSYVNWEGEDGEIWQCYFDGESMTIREGETIYTPQLDPTQLRDIVLPALNRDSMDAEHEALSQIADLLGIEYDENTEQYALTN